jgi:hypothetical protein
MDRSQFSRGGCAMTAGVRFTDDGGISLHTNPFYDRSMSIALN